MPALSDYTSGTITLTNGSVNFTGAGTGWQAADFREGDTILGIEDNAGVEYVIASITGNGAGTLTQEWEGATGTYQYRMRYMADGARVTAQARNLIELLGNGNLQALAGLTGPGVPVFNGPHAMEIKPVTDFTNGVAYDVQVDTLPDRAAYNGQSEGFAVLVSDMGDGRSALFSKASNTSGDWTDPAYITGPVGPIAEVTVGTTITGAPGTPASVTGTPTVDGIELDFTIPAGEGFSAEGDYSGSTAYVKGDVVQYQGSSWIALQATTGNTPPSLPTTNNAYWQLLARAGNDGAGTVTTLIAGDGIDVDSTDPTEPIISGVLFDEDVQGQVPGPTEEDILAGRVLKADGTWGDSGGSVDSLFLDDLTGDFDANEKAQARENIGAGKASTVATKSDNYTVVEDDNGNVIAVDAATTARTITLLPAAAAGNGFKLVVKKVDSSANLVAIDANGSETISGALTKALSQLGQFVELVCDGSNWLIVGENDASVVTTAFGTYSAYSSFSTVLPADDTVPTSSEGTNIITVTINVKSTLNKLRATFVGMIARSNAGVVAAAIVKSGDGSALHAIANRVIGDGQVTQVTMQWEWTPTAIGSQSYQLRAGPGGPATIYVNGDSGGRYFGGIGGCSFKIEEVRA